MPPRTKACALCRHKRIKCDATLPHCLMCIRNGKQCPGPVDGPLIIDMTMQTVKRTKAKKKTKAARKPVVAPRSESPVSTVDLAVSPITQPSQTYAINQAFFANFLTYFASTGEDKDLQNRMTWMHILPALASDGTNTALTLALRATALAYTGSEARNLAVLQEACKLYGQALHVHARLIKAKPEEVTTHTISTSIMLSMFEAMLSTSGDAYREHVYGAAKMFELAGPEFCRNGVLCQLFFHVRTQMAFVYLTTGRAKPISVKKILTDSLMYKRLPVFQKLMSLIAKLAEIYVTNTHAYMTPKQRAENLRVFLPVKTDIITLYQDYQARGAAKNNPVSWKDEYGITQYRDSFTAMAMSYFHAAHILISVLSPRLGADYVDYEDHCEPILESSRFLEIKRVGCSYMRMAMPLYLVALHGTYAEQRDEAVRIFHDWKSGGMAGLSYLALETIQKRREEEMLENAMPFSGPVLDPILNVEYLPLPTRTGIIEIES